MGYRKNQEPDHTKDHHKHAEQKPPDNQVGHPLLFGAGMCDAKRGYEGLGEPGENFQGSFCLRSEYVIYTELVICFEPISWAS